MKYILINILLAGALISVSAQQKWTLRQCIDYAIEHNINIKQQELAIKNSEVNLNTSQNSRLPDLNANPSQSFNFGRSPSSTTGTYDANNSASTGVSVSSSLPIFNGFRISNDIKSNELNLKAATEGLNKAKDNISINIALYYMEVLFKKEILKVREEQCALTAKQMERTSLMVESGSVPRSQLFDIKAQFANDEMNVITAKNDLSLSLLNLSQMLNLLDLEGFDIMEPQQDIDIVTQIVQSPKQIYETAVITRPQIKEAEYNLENSEIGVKIAQSYYWPSLNMRLSYGNGYDYVFNNVRENKSFSAQLKENQREAIGMNMNIPIFNRMQTRNQVQSAHINVMNKELELENIKLALQKEIQQAYLSATAAQSKYTATEKALDAAQESYLYTEERYELGKATVFELVESQTKLSSSRSEQLQAKYEFLFREKILNLYEGKEIK